ncbi:hypothetical protein CAMRE0001_1646 [Campylobacter rectus RM3267]|uniref:Uncharacterized protein n=1 Tax=Campylobacter rectus RM3267 TaxID=553218 RepID=B9CZ67_CAMRE|nr:hypothetical protein CAMRE0001_1646 [Campylobacter rectus RM3267]
MRVNLKISKIFKFIALIKRNSHAILSNSYQRYFKPCDGKSITKFFVKFQPRAP